LGQDGRFSDEPPVTLGKQPARNRRGRWSQSQANLISFQRQQMWSQNRTCANRQKKYPQQRIKQNVKPEVEGTDAALISGKPASRNAEPQVASGKPNE